MESEKNDKGYSDLDTKFHKTELWNADQRNHRNHMTGRKGLDILLVVCFCVMIFGCAFYKIIGGETVAALLGTMIGYCLEHWRNKRD